MSTYALIQDGVVSNVIVWDGGAEWTPPDGATAELLPADSPVAPGYTFDGATYTAPASAT